MDIIKLAVLQYRLIKQYSMINEYKKVIKNIKRRNLNNAISYDKKI